jgi:sodium/potassium-transporting ATPase subunit beta
MSSNYQVTEVSTRKRTCCQRFLRFLFDPDKKTFCSRTCLSWLSIIGFYIVFYLFLAGFFAIILSIYVHGIVNKSMPMLTGNQSLLLGGPGVKIDPIYRSTKNESTLLYLNLINLTLSTATNNNEYQKYVNSTNQLLQNYNSTPSSDQDPCSDTTIPQPANVNKPCFFNAANELGPCYKPSDYVLKNSTMCLFVRVNRIYGWLPDLTDTSLGSPLIECKGQNPADVENLGIVNYYPSVVMNGTKYGKISNIYFPYTRQPSYSTPLVAVELAQLKPNVVVLMKCGVRNININDGGTAGDTQFEVMLDKISAM